MIIGSSIVYKCDGNGCEAIKVVPVELEEEFNALWHNGLTHHFCKSCKQHFRNQAAIVNDEQAALRLKTEVMKRAA